MSEVRFTCPTAGCGRVYKATAALAGKIVVCKGCGKKIRVPPEAGRAPTTPREHDGARQPPHLDPSPGTRPAKSRGTARCPKCGAVSPTHAPAREIQCPACETTFAVSTSGAAEVRSTAPPTPTADDPPVPDDSDHGGSSGWELAESDGEYKFQEEPTPTQPADAWRPTAAEPTTFESPVPARKRKQRRNRLQFLEDIADSTALLALCGGLAVAVLMAIGFFSPAMAFALRLLGGLIGVAGFIWAIRLAMDESGTCAVLYILDCTSIYRLYYTITRWSDMKHAFMMEVAGSLLFIPWAYHTFDSEKYLKGPNTTLEAEVHQDAVIPDLGIPE